MKDEINNKNKAIKSRIIELRKAIIKHNHLYHTLDTSEISDQAYDQMLITLENLENKNRKLSDSIIEIKSPVYSIGGSTVDKFIKVKHNIPQWSFEKVFNFKELLEWEERNINFLEKENTKLYIDENIKNKNIDKSLSSTHSIEYICELKIDGLKLVLTYDDGELVNAVTRGDGEVGEDVLNNALVIKDIPKTLNTNNLKSELGSNINYFLENKIIVIGEVWMENKELKKINDNLKLDFENKNKLGSPKLYANARNLAAGTLRQLDSRVVASRNLKFFAYDIETEIKKENISLEKNKIVNNSMTTQSFRLLTLKSLGFVVNKENKICKNLNYVERFYQSWTEKRKSMAYGIDGIVIKINDRALWNILGYTAKAPRGGVAYKFPAEVTMSKVEKIILQVGRTGAITPVALLTPVSLDGSIVSRATLHNMDEINRLDIRVGDTIELRKAGDIIPEIFNVITDLRPSKSLKYKMSDKCPSCEGTLSRQEQGKNKIKEKDHTVAIYCKNKNCPAQHIEGLIHFASKKAMNIENMGDKIIEQMVELGYITDYVSIYNLYSHKKDLENLEGFGEKSIENLLYSIEYSRNTTLSRFIFALGIRHVGENTAKDIAKFILKERKNINLQKAIELFKEMSIENYLNIEGVGQIIADSLYRYWHDENNLQKIKILCPYIHLKDKEVVSLNDGKFAGMTFVITGTLQTMNRDQAKEYIEEHGGKVTSSISSHTDYLLAGVDAGSKMTKANGLGIKIISEIELVSV